MSARRLPISPPAKVAKSLAQGQKAQQVVVIDDIAMYPPNAKRPTWRIKYNLAGKSPEFSGGKTVATAWAAYLAAQDSRTKRIRSATGIPELGHIAVSEVVDAYIQSGGKTGKWKKRTAEDRRRDLAGLREIGKSVLAEDLNASHLREYVAKAGTQDRADHFINIVGTFLTWAWKSGYLTKDQATLAEEVAWCRPANYEEPAGNRRQRSKAFAKTATGAPGGEVPTHSQVNGLAAEVLSRYRLGDGLIHSAANLGLRCSELLLMTASEAVAESRGNFVDVPNGEVRVRLQVAGTAETALPKGTKIRDVVIPHVSLIGTEFNLREWLALRCEEALIEQRKGTNPLALVLPSPKGLVWGYSNLNNRVVTPSLDAMGWKMDSYQTAHGRTITPRRFTLHSMRDRFATTVKSRRVV